MKYLFLTLFIFKFITSIAQENYIVFFKDKAKCEFDPCSYFDAKAIERRISSGIPLYDSTDFPVSQSYTTILSQKVSEINGESRWFNAIFVKATEEQLKEIKQLPFVKGIETLRYSAEYCSNNEDEKLSEENIAFLARQTGHLQGNLFKSDGFTGKGIRIAIFDGGFPNVDQHKAFAHIRKANRILKTFDFTSNKENVYLANSHGTNVLSCIAGIIDSIPLGLATEAEFILARTEINSEPFSEERNWLKAVEWADKNGAQIINSSLGYTDSRYFPWEMNGKKSLVSKAANMAASKGMLVVNAAGNEGDNKWKKIITPADADSVLSIGGIDPTTSYHQSFSSFGPTADWRLKPNVCAFSHVIAASPKSFHETDGTSFASPLVAGFAACAWQNHPEYNNMQLFKEIEKSGSLYPYFDYAHGYGIPQASYFLNTPKAPIEPSVKIEINETEIIVKAINKTEKNNDQKYLYYHIQDSKGRLKKYAVIEVYQEDIIHIYSEQYEKGDILRIHYLGYTLEQTL